MTRGSVAEDLFVFNAEKSAKVRKTMAKKNSASKVSANPDRDIEAAVRALGGTLEEGFAVVDAQENIVFVNASFCHILGISEKTLLQSKICDYFPRSKLDKICRQAALVKKVAARSFDFAIKSGDHDLKNARLSAIRWQTRKTSVRSAGGMILLLSEQKNDDAVACFDDAGFQKISDSILVGLTFISSDRIHYVNNRACDIFGYPRHKLMNMNLMDLAAPEEKEWLQAVLKEAQRTGTLPPELDFWFIRGDGVKRCIRNRYSLYREDDEIIGLFVVSTDITERRLAEEGVRESRELYRSLVENIDLGITSLDLHHTIVMANAGQGRLFGKNPEEFFGKKCYTEFEKRSDICPHCPGVRAMESGRSAEAETEGIRDDGSRFKARIQAFPVFKNDHTVAGFIEVVEDVTERKKMEDELARHYEARIEAERKQQEAAELAAQAAQLASIGVIAAGITHEVNQPLSAVQVHADTLLYLVKEKNYQLPEPFTKIFYEMSEGTRRISDIIQHMRSFWLSTHSAPLEPVDLNEAIRSSLTLVTRKALSHSIRLKEELASEKVIINANKLQVEQIVLNIISNSIHSLDQKSENRKEIGIRTAIAQDRAVLQISDNGIGLATEQSEVLFSPFFSTKKPGQGMGLGLAIVKMFVDRFKGEISAANNEEGGATFTLSFPLVSSQTATFPGEDRK